MTVAVAPTSVPQTSRLYTFDEMVALPDDGRLYELVHGKLVEKHVGHLSTWLATELSRLIGNHVAADHRGYVAIEQPIDCFTWIQRHGRRPDLIYHHASRLPQGVPTQDPLRIAPDWVAEVLSPNDEAIDVDVKVEEYLRAGIELVWVINPEIRTVRVHQANGRVALFHENDIITAEPVLPDLSFTVNQLFPRKQSSTTPPTPAE